MRWIYLLLATAAQAAASMTRLGIPPIMPLLRDDFGLDRVQIGLISSALNAGASASGIPGGRLVDRVGDRLVMAYATAGSGLAILAVYLAPSFPALLLVVLVTGFMSAVSVPAGGVLVTRWFGRHERGLAMGVRQTGVPLGGALAAMVLPGVALVTDWRLALGLTGVVALILGLLVTVFYRAPSSPHLDAARHRPVPLINLLRRKDIAGLVLYSFVFGAGQWCMVTYLVLDLTETHGMSIQLAGSMLGAAMLCGAFGRVFWGFVTDRFMQGRRVPALLIVALIGVLSTVAMALTGPETPYPLVAVIVGLLGLALHGWNGLPHVLAPELAGGRAAGVAVGMINTAGFGGVVVFPPLFGLLVDQTGSYRIAWLAMIGLLLVGLVVLPWVNRSEMDTLHHEKSGP